MDLKSIDLDRVEKEIRETADDSREHFEKFVALKIGEIRTAVDAARLLEKLPTGELVQRAALADVLEIRIPDAPTGIHPRGTAALLGGSFEFRLFAHRDSFRTGDEWRRVDVDHRRPPVTVKTGTNYRLLLFLVEVDREKKP
jgi:hypothetical protein